MAADVSSSGSGSSGSGSSGCVSIRLLLSLLRRCCVTLWPGVRRRRCGLADLGRSWHDDITCPCDNED